MRDLNDMACFAAVVRHQGFSPAARTLRLPKSQLSRRVARLEERLGLRLLERSTRRVSVTEAGREYYRHCQAMIAEAEAADEAAARVQAQPQGLVRVGCPNGLSQQLAETMPRFLANYPKLRVQFVMTSRPLDLIEDRIDVAIRVRPQLDTDPNLIVKILGTSRLLLVASPGLLGQHGTPASPGDLHGLPTLGHTEQPGETVWQLEGPDGARETFAHEPRLATTDFQILLESTLAGVGIACLPEQLVLSSLRDGRLVRILPDWHGGEGLRHLVFTSRRGMAPAVRVVIDLLAELLTPDPLLDQPVTGTRSSGPPPRR
ncbi:MAG TPA: LysR family transcriptional regulator [Geminicoccus sp.]|uniref:LysR family transcriptional regulator n=1 Tax=Geminicoccus sp. TaxID=2024832 RepID=UPI002BEE00C9|nr:LysR family transcriptional regulator [Geminicoccus sp.]HWL69612.1 LysR family transcriptional regulator [Geminicoccus sp.]